MNKYTNIGEAVVTSTVLGKAKVRVVQRRGMRGVMWSLLAILVLGLVVAAWLGRGKQKPSAAEAVAVAQIADQEKDSVLAAPHRAQPEKIVRAQTEHDDAKQVADKPEVSTVNPQQQARNEFRKAQQLAQQGKTSEAIESYRSTLLLDAGNDVARQAMVDLLLKTDRKADAERALQLGLKNSPNSSSYSLQLSRLLAERNDLSSALDVMQRTLPYAAGQADYLAFYASLLQRQNRYSDAVTYYQKALGLKPDSGEWLMGMGISLQATGRTDEANDAFRRALKTRNLSPQSRAFVEKQVPAPAAAIKQTSPSVDVDKPVAPSVPKSQ